MSILGAIVNDKRAEVARLKERTTVDALRRRARATSAPRGFRAALERAPGPLAVIAEIKRKSPSKGTFRDRFDPAELARRFEAGGAAALSVLTDEKYFGGNLGHLETARAATGLPILRKDFLLDEIQVFESRAAGADAVLLIAAILSREELEKMAACAAENGMDALVELGGEGDVEKIKGLSDPLVGINNRDLATFQVSFEATRRLLSLVPGRFVVSESGVGSRSDLLELKKAGARAALVGEALMKAADPGSELRGMLQRGADG